MRKGKGVGVRESERERGRENAHEEAFKAKYNIDRTADLPWCR